MRRASRNVGTDVVGGVLTERTLKKQSREYLNSGAEKARYVGKGRLNAGRFERSNVRRGKIEAKRDFSPSLGWVRNDRCAWDIMSAPVEAKPGDAPSNQTKLMRDSSRL